MGRKKQTKNFFRKWPTILEGMQELMCDEDRKAVIPRPSPISKTNGK